MTKLASVAREAGLSTAAVSRYLNKKLELPQATRDRVDAAVKKLGYRPNLMARRFKLGSTEAIALLVPEITNPFFAALASAVETEAERNGFAVYLSSSKGKLDREINSLRRLSEQHMDGLILCTNRPDDGALAAHLDGFTNVVIVDEDLEGPNLPRIFVDNFAGTLAATRHLIEIGHCDIALVGGPEGLFSCKERFAGYAAALAEAGLKADPERVLFGDYSMEHGKRAARWIFDSSPRPTAVLACSDFVAIGLMQEASILGLSVPDDLSIVGFDDMPFSQLLTPSLTTVRQPVEEMGRRAVQYLLSASEQEGTTRLCRLPIELVVRESVAAPKTWRKN